MIEGGCLGVSHYIHRVGGHPDVDLFEADFELLLELPEEFAVSRQVRYFDEEPRQVVVINSSFMFPNATQDLGFPRSGTELLSQFAERFYEQRLRDRLAVVKQQRHQDLVAT